MKNKGTGTQNKVPLKQSDLMHPNFKFKSEHFEIEDCTGTVETVSEDKRNFARVRRSSDNAELDFTWQDIIKGKVLNWVNKNGTADGFVAIEYNPSGNGNDIVHTTAVHQPRLVTSGVLNTLNGKPALEKAYEPPNYGCQYSSSCTGTTESTLQEKFEREFGIHFKDKGTGKQEEIMDLRKGGCLEVIQQLKDEGIDMEDVIFVSDPPFNIGYNYNEYNDKMKEDDYYQWLGDIFGNVPTVLVHYHEQLYKFAFQIGDFPEKIVSWVYNANTPKQHRGIAFFGVKPDFRKSGQDYKNPKDKRIAKRIANGERARLYDWWEIQQVKNVSKEKTEHTCQMPLAVMERIIEILPDDKIIIDPFMGSGTTGIACKKLGRNFIGIELDEKYFKIAKNRIENYE